MFGWFLEGEEEIFFKEEFIKMFDLKCLFKLLVLFDNVKLIWVNN